MRSLQSIAADIQASQTPWGRGKDTALTDFEASADVEAWSDLDPTSMYQYPAELYAQEYPQQLGPVGGGLTADHLEPRSLRSLLGNFDPAVSGGMEAVPDSPLSAANAAASAAAPGLVDAANAAASGLDAGSMEQAPLMAAMQPESLMAFLDSTYRALVVDTGLRGTLVLDCWSFMVPRGCPSAV